MNYCLDISRQVETLMQASPLVPIPKQYTRTLQPLLGSSDVMTGRI